MRLGFTDFNIGLCGSNGSPTPGVAGLRYAEKSAAFSQFESDARMSDSRKHRGPHPEDGRLFATDQLPALREATRDLSWLLSRDYASPSALKLVGDRYQLEARQRIAAAR